MSPEEVDDLPRIRAEAAAWLARLRSDSVSEADRSGFQAWLGADTRHAEALEAISATWDLVGGASMARPMRSAPPTTSWNRPIFLSLGLIAAAGLAFAYFWVPAPDVYTTRIGEQRRLLLADGSHVLLDAGSQISVTMSASSRGVTLDQGRAYFEETPDANRPFVVTAGAERIVPLGTAFQVTHDRALDSALLVTGKISVSRTAQDAAPAVLEPGERIVFGRDGAVRRDRPNLQLALSWQQGRVGFERTRLSEAIDEMNRYSRQKLVIANPEVADLQISGLFWSGDNQSFARSVAAFLPVTIEIRPEAILISGKNSGMARSHN